MNSPLSLLSSLDQCTIVPPSLHAWAYAIAVHGGCCVFGGIPCGILLYPHLLKKNEGNSNSNHTITIRSVVGVCVGITAVVVIYIGRPVIESYSPNNQITFIGPLFASTFGFTTFFKSLNVATRTYPEGADRDLQTWLWWFIMTPEPTFAKGKTSKVNRTEVVIKARDFFFKITAVFLLLTVLMRHPPPYYQVITTKTSSSFDDNNGILDWLLSTHVNGFIHLWLLYSFVAFCLDFSTILNYIFSSGVRMEPAFCNPLLRSRSFKETWGTRWNRPVNALLKRTIYIPARKSGLFGNNQNRAAVLTFFASGLLHEYNFSIHNHPSISLSSGYRPGEVTIFFLVMGLLMIGESWVWNRYFPRWLQTAIDDHLPSMMTASILTFMVAGLAERYFLRGWFLSGFVEAVAQMLPYLHCE